MATPPVPADSLLAPSLAARSLFLDISPSPGDLIAPPSPLSPAMEPTSSFQSAVNRIRGLTDHLTGDMQTSLIATLTVLNSHFPDLATTTQLQKKISDPRQSAPEDLLQMADTISRGMRAFMAKSGPTDTPAVALPTDPLHAPAAPSKRSSKRSATIRTACRIRDGGRCRICGHSRGVSCHIVPFSLKGGKSVDFWAFIALFRGEVVAAAIRAAALHPTPDSVDNLMNVVYLCPNCHDIFDDSLLALLPLVLHDPAISFPYDPSQVAEYQVAAEFPFGLDDAEVLILQPNGQAHRMQPGHAITLRTANSTRHPLPHPLLLQLHVVVSRMLVLKAAAGYPVLQPYSDSEADFLCYEEALEYQNDPDIAPRVELLDESSDLNSMCVQEAFSERPRKAAVVIKELGQRMQERRTLMNSRLGHVC